MAQGTGVSSGVSFAQAMIWQAPQPGKTTTRKTNNPQRELRRFQEAHKRVLDSNNEVRQKTARRFGDTEAAIFDAYHMMLGDEEGLIQPVRHSIEIRHFTAEYAISSQFNLLAQQFLELPSEYLRQRAEDIYALRDQLLRELHGAKSPDCRHLPRPTIVLAHALSPVDLANMDLSRLEGIICETGGYTSHMSIIARTLGIPAIVGARDILTSAHNGDAIALDGESGEIWINPGKQDIDYLRTRSAAVSYKQELSQLYRGLPTITTDGHRVELAANISRLSFAGRALESDAECIGMFRTEMVHHDRMPMASEEAQFMVFRSLLETMAGKAVTVRTYDDGGNQPTIPIKGGLMEDNPVMGYRGVRLSLGRAGFFRTQLRAMLRASAYGTLKILLPMVATMEELEECLAILEDVKLELQREHIPYDEDTPVGLLIEVPAAALQAQAFAQRVNFFTISISSLIQFTMAVDRNNYALNYLYHMHHPVIIRLLQWVTNAAHEQDIPCYLSGDMPGYEKALPLLLGIGLDGFSTTPGNVLPARRVLNSLSFNECFRLAQQVLAMDSAHKIEALLEQFYEAHQPMDAEPLRERPSQLQAAE